MTCVSVVTWFLSFFQLYLEASVIDFNAYPNLAIYLCSNSSISITPSVYLDRGIIVQS